MTNIPKAIWIQLSMIAIMLGLLLGPKAMQALQKDDPTAPELAATSTPQRIPIDPFQGVALSAKSAFVWDIKEHKKLFGKNEYDHLPLASVTKVMMALVALENNSSDRTVTVSANDLKEDGDQGLLAGEKWKLSDLINFTLVTSSNDGASAIAAVGLATLPENTSRDEQKRTFIEAMNQKARSIGLLDTQYSNESGLDIDSYQSGGNGSARDMAMLYEYVWRKYPKLFEATAYKNEEVRSLSGIVHHIANTNDYVDRIPGIIGSKTGFTDLAGGNLVIIADIGIDHPVVIAVLGSTRTDRFSDVEKLRDRAVLAIANSN